MVGCGAYWRDLHPQGCRGGGSSEPCVVRLRIAPTSASLRAVVPCIAPTVPRRTSRSPLGRIPFSTRIGPPTGTEVPHSAWPIRDSRGGRADCRTGPAGSCPGTGPRAMMTTAIREARSAYSAAVAPRSLRTALSVRQIVVGMLMSVPTLRTRVRPPGWATGHTRQCVHRQPDDRPRNLTIGSRFLRDRRSLGRWRPRRGRPRRRAAGPSRGRRRPRACDDAGRRPRRRRRSCRVRRSWRRTAPGPSAR